MELACGITRQLGQEQALHTSYTRKTETWMESRKEVTASGNHGSYPYVPRPHPVSSPAQPGLAVVNAQNLPPCQVPG